MDEQRIREIVREEINAILGEKQGNCPHSVSATYQNDGSIQCDGCGKTLAEGDD